MPIYEYRCRACGHTAEELRAPDQADAPVTCVCGRTDSVRLPSLVARSSSSGVGAELPMAGGGGGAGGGGCCGGGCCG
jgi:putative FmdB family regulatory protein